MSIANPILEQIVQSLASAVWKRPELTRFRQPIQKALEGKQFKQLTEEAFTTLAERSRGDLPDFFSEGFITHDVTQRHLTDYIIEGREVTVGELAQVYADYIGAPEKAAEIETQLSGYLKQLRETLAAHPAYGPLLLARDMQSMTAALNNLRGEMHGRFDEVVEHLKGDSGDVIPYLHWLHNESKKSSLLRILKAGETTEDVTPITVDQVYTPLDTSRAVLRDERGRVIEIERSDLFDRQQFREEAEASPMSAMEAANRTQHLILLGDPGSGKSTFVNYLALCLSGQMLEPEAGWLKRLEEQGWEQGARLPVVVTLRDLAQNITGEKMESTASQIFQHSEDGLKKLELREAFPVIKNALNKGGALVLMDGLDEVPPEKREQVNKMVTAFMERCHQDTRYIVTCRILSYTDPKWHIPELQEERIVPFDEDKIKQFIRAWYTTRRTLRQVDSETAEDLIGDLTTSLEHSHLQGVASNPMLLTVMTVVHNLTGTLPEESARLYEECVKLLMWRWKPERAKFLVEKLGVGESDLYRMLWEVAYEAHSKQAEREGAADIAEEDVIGIVRRHLDDKLGLAQEFCEYVEKRAGLLVGRGSVGHWRVFTFPHRTFQEYLAGCHIVANDFDEWAPGLARLGTTWREVLLLATGHLVYNQQQVNMPLRAISELCLGAEGPVDDADWRCVWLAGEMLEKVGVRRALNTARGQRVVPGVRRRLAELVDGGQLPVAERADCGRVLAEVGDERAGVGLRSDGLPEIEWCEVPIGKFLYSDDKQTANIPYDYAMAKYPVTYAQYEAFVASDGYRKRQYWTEAGWEWKGDKQQPERYWKDPKWHIDNHPVVGVTWYEAYAFTQWLGAKLGYEVRLPTEQEWEKAARGVDGREYPWGDEWDETKCNNSVGDSSIGQTSAVGIFPTGVSPCGALGMAGNVWEWCLTEYESGENHKEGTNRRVLRGGSWVNDDSYYFRAASRYRYFPFLRGDYWGFRCARLY